MVIILQLRLDCNGQWSDCREAWHERQRQRVRPRKPGARGDRTYVTAYRPQCGRRHSGRDRPRGNEFLDRLEELLSDEGLTVKRYVKERFSRIAATELKAQIGEECDLAVEALAD